MKKDLPLLQNRKVYPECYVPPNILKIFEGEVKELIEENRPKFTQEEPSNILKPPEEPKFEDIFTALIILCSIGLFFQFTAFLIVILFLVIGGWVNYYTSKRIYPKLLNTYNHEVLKFNEAKQLFKKKLEDHKNEIEIYNEKINSHSFLSILIIKVLHKTFVASPYPSITVKPPLKGRSEAFFERYLFKYFGDTIRKDCTIEIFQYLKKMDYNNAYLDYNLSDKYIEVENCFIPDFCFIHPNKALKIDIEIDEPYTLKKPIHFIGVDNNRNNYFVNKNWIVIRFSEQQVLKAPDECCREIAEIIYDFTNDASYINSLTNYGRLTRLKKWRKEEAQSFTACNFRNSYSSLEAFSIDLEMIYGSWDCDEMHYEFNGVTAKKIIKNRGIREQFWKRYKGIFYVNRDEFNRCCIKILWESNLRENLIIDCLTSSALILTNMYTRDIYFLTLGTRYGESYMNISYEANSIDSFTIAEIKRRFGYKQLPLLRANNTGGSTEYYYHSDNEKQLTLLIPYKLANKIKLEAVYDKIIFGKSFFIKIDRTNHIGLELQDLNSFGN